MPKLDIVVRALVEREREGTEGGVFVVYFTRKSLGCEVA